MTTQQTSDNTLRRVYMDRIGQPNNDGEVMGYWIFALGALVGILGFLTFVPSGSATGLREISIAAGAIGLPLLLAGPVIRLPLDRRATGLVVAGVIACFAGVAWFVAIFPSGWDPAAGFHPVTGLYSVGLGAIAAGGVFVPMLYPGEESERNEELMQQRDDARADEADIAEELEDSRDERDDLQQEVDDTLADEGDLAEELEDSHDERDDLQQKVDDTLADEADLARELVASQVALAAAERPESQAGFEIFQDADDEWRWRLRHTNGNVLAVSGQGYARRTGAQNGMESVRRDAFGAAAITITDDEEATDGDDGADADAVTIADADESKATFEIYEDAGGEQWRWRLLHDNGNIIADGSEGYASKANVERAMDKIRGHIAAANYLHIDPVAYELNEDDEGQWRWRLIHKNGNVLASSARGYDARPGAREAVMAAKKALSEAEVTER